jgi:acid phosphatase family membrane protein YuiD
MHSFLQEHAIFLIPIIVSVITQLIKFAMFGIKHGWKLEYLATHGHMPSSHTAFAISLITSIGYYEGIGSGAFAVAVAVAFLIIDDAVRLRMYLGDQGRYLNTLIQTLKLSTTQFPRLKERVGHRTSEVLVGGFVGFFLATIFIRILG